MKIKKDCITSNPNEIVCILTNNEVKTLAAVQEFVQDFTRLTEQLAETEELKKFLKLRIKTQECQNILVNRLLNYNT